MLDFLGQVVLKVAGFHTYIMVPSIKYILMVCFQGIFDLECRRNPFSFCLRPVGNKSHDSRFQRKYLVDHDLWTAGTRSNGMNALLLISSLPTVKDSRAIRNE